MPLTASSDQVRGALVLLGKGKIYFDRKDSGGAFTGLRFLGNCTKLEETTSDEVKEKFSSASKDAPLLKRVTTRRTVEFGIAIDEFDEWNMALGTMSAEPSAASSYTQSAGAVTAQATSPAAVKQGRWYDLGARNISAVTVKVGASTKTITTDYLLDLVGGRVYIVPGGGIADADAVTVDYTKAAITSPGLPKLSGGSAGIIEGRLQFIGDPATGPVWQLDIWNASLTPEGTVGFISDEFGEFGVKLTAQDDSLNHPNEPLYRLIKVS